MPLHHHAWDLGCKKFPLLIYDSFTDTNGVLLDAHTPNKSPATAWVHEQGSFAIQSNWAQFNATGAYHLPWGNYALALIDCKKADATVSALVRPPEGDGIYQFGLVVRAIDNQNLILANLCVGANQFGLCSVIDGTFATDETSAGIVYTRGVDYIVEVVCQGGLITATLNGTTVLSHTYAVLLTPTKVGFIALAAGEIVSEFQVVK